MVKYFCRFFTRLDACITFLIYIKDLCDNLSSNLNLFAEETWLFTVVHDMNQSGINLNDDLKKKSEK